MIEAFDFVVFVDDLKGSVAQLAKTFGFVEQSEQYGIRHFMAGKVSWLIHPARNVAERFLLQKRGPSPYMIGLKTEDKAIAHPYSLLGLPAANSPYIYELDQHLLFCKTPFQWHQQTAINSKVNYSAIDHFAIACPKASVVDYVQNLCEQFSLQKTYSLDVEDGHSGMQSVALANANHQVRLPIIGPDGPSSQVQMFLDQANGPGIQHIGLATDNIIETVRHLKNEGIRFLSIKDDYYDSEAFNTMPLSDADKQACRELSILADKDEQGNYLLQIFTEPLLGPMMIEIIERHNHNTFGARNIKSLFDTVADYQNRQVS